MRLSLLILLINALTLHIGGGFAGPDKGGTGSVGVGYELAAQHFLFSLGVEGGYDYLTQRVPDGSAQLPYVDSEGVPYTRLEDYRGRTDLVQQAEVRLPVMLGGGWERVYFLLGAKPAYSLYAVQQTSAQVTVRGNYDMFYDIFHDMPNHGYTTTPYLSPVQQGTSALSVYATAEVGARLSRHSRLSLFADYPVWSQALVTPYRVGVKLTFGWGRIRTTRYPCQCYFF